MNLNNTIPFTICLEGLEGAGKTTGMASISRYFENNNLPFVQVREPGGTPMAESIRHVHKSQHDENVSPLTELLLMYAARYQLLSNVNQPALESGKFVITDRSWISSYAYQRLDDETFFSIHNAVMRRIPSVDVVIYLRVSPEVGLERARGRGELDRIEQNGLAFFEAAAKRYESIIKERFPVHLIVDTEKLDIDGVSQQIHSFLDTLFDAQ